MAKPMKQLGIFIVVCIFVFSYPTTANAQIVEGQPRPAIPNNLRVQVRVDGGPPPGLVRVELFRGNMPVEEGYCNSEGEYLFLGLEQGFYTLRASLPGFRSELVETPLQSGAERNVYINLRPGRDVSARGSREIMDLMESEGSLTVPVRVREEFARARELRTTRDFLGAIRVLQNVIELDPTFAAAHSELGLCYRRLGQLDDAQASFETAIEHDASLLSPYLNLADVLAEKQAFNDAAKILVRATEVHPDRGEPYYVMARIQLNTGHPDAAEKAARMALERDYSRIPEVHLLLANIYLGRDEPGLVAVELEYYLELAPDGDQVETARAKLVEVRKELENRAFIPLQQYEDMVDSYRAGRYSATAKALSQMPSIILMEASDAYRKRHTKDAERMAAALLHTETARLLGKSGSFHLNKSIEYLAFIQDDALRGQWFLTIGYYFHSKRRFLDAVPFLFDASRLLPKNVEIRLALGSALESAAVTRGFANLLEQAEKHYRRVLKEEPDNGEAHLRLGHVLKLLGQSKEATRELNEALAKTSQPDQALVAHLILGDIHRANGDDWGAIASYRIALGIEPDCQVTATALAYALHRAGDLTGSRKVMTDLLERKRASRKYTDAWWRYMLGHSHEFDLMLARMRQEVIVP
jgi:tetratricopeptide (TPR) repeat protein